MEPTVVGDLVYVGSCAGNMYAFDIQSGDIRWQYDVSGDGASQFHGNPLVLDSVLYFGTDQGLMNLGAIYAVNRLTGELIWAARGFSGMASHLATDGHGHIYAVSRNDTLFALSAATGGIEWSFASEWVRDEDWEAAAMIELPPTVSSPAVVGDEVVFCGRDSVLYALSPRGELRWSHRFDDHVTTGITLLEDRLFLGVSDYQMISVALDSGHAVRFTPLEMIAQDEMLAAGGQIIFLGGYSDARPAEVLAIDASGYSLRWQYTVDDPDPEAYWYVPRVHPIGERCIVGTTTGRVLALDLASGERVWQAQLDSPIRGVGHGSGMLFVGTFDGVLHAFRLDTVEAGE